jgi:cardiolipin synthase
MGLPRWLEGGPPRAPDRLRLLDGGAGAFPAMLDAIRAARDEILLEVYRFAQDRVGALFTEALAAAVRRDVQVRVVLDGWGSAPHAGEVARRLAAAGCQVEIFNRVLFVLFGRLRRNHRKVLAVDGEVAFVGSLNLCEEHGLPGAPSPAAWADLALEVRGPTAEWLLRRGRRERGHSPAGPVRIWLSGLGGGRRLRHRYLKAIGAARAAVLLAHAYFVPDRHLVRSITAAARRGVAVRLVVPARSDVLLARPATRRLYRRLQAAGVEVREWPNSVLHAKVAAVDGRRLLLGSFNLDPFSLANLEALAEVEDPALAGEGARWIEARLAEALPVPPEVVGSTSLAAWLERLAGGFAAAVARLLARLLRRR